MKNAYFKRGKKYTMLFIYRRIFVLADRSFRSSFFADSPVLFKNVEKKILINIITHIGTDVLRLK